MSDQPNQPQLTTPILTLEHLPAELLYEIQLYSLSSSLPYVSRHLNSVFTHSSAQHKAHFVLLAHPNSTLQHAVRYPICTLTVIHALERIKPLWNHRPTHKLKCKELPTRLLNGLGKKAKRRAEGESHDDENERARREEGERLELIRYLLVNYNASANSRNGYFLARAVLARDLPLIELLLAHGADPAQSNASAVHVAIGNGDLSLVKLLMEREIVRPEEQVKDEDGEGGKKSKRRRSSDGGGGGKRRKLDERCEATSAMLETAAKKQQWPIFHYLRDLGATPSLGVLKLL